LELIENAWEKQMLRMIKWIGVPVLAVALLTGLDAPKAEAGNGFSLQIGRFGISTGNYGYGSSFNRGYNQRSLGHNSYYGARSYGAGRYGVGNHGAQNYRHGRSYHDTTHLDYHPPQLIPHGNHYDVQPGHYDVHRTGHWHH
jgi:hypothetical protein